MRMTAGVRKVALTLHVTSSVGWLGAVVAFLALAIAGLASPHGNTVRASYLAMELIGWSVIVPLAFAAAPTGILMSLGTEWGLFRHYWVFAKLLISAAATVLLVVHMQPVGHLARAVVATTALDGELAGLRLQLVADASAATVALLIATALSVFKPRGLTPFARSGGGAPPVPAPRAWSRLALMALGVAIGIFAVVHLLTGGAGH
jgi:hypothetical protein